MSDLALGFLILDVLHAMRWGLVIQRELHSWLQILGHPVSHRQLARCIELLRAGKVVQISGDCTRHGPAEFRLWAVPVFSVTPLPWELREYLRALLPGEEDGG